MPQSFIEAVDSQATRVPKTTAFCNSSGQSINYARLKQDSDALACWIDAQTDIPPKCPIVVYGHKSPLMLVSFLACVKSGHAYVPIDVIYPKDRITSIIAQLGSTAVIDTNSALPEVLGDTLSCSYYDLATIEKAVETYRTAGSKPKAVGPHDAFYILFTSGSTGEPKGVEILRECVDNFSAWFRTSEFAVSEHKIWFNRAPYTFDLSLTDIAGGLAKGDTLFALDEDTEQSLAASFNALALSGVNNWVSTPSFIDQCLSDESFNRELIPQLERIITVGEVLRPETVRRVKERFDGLKVFNGYGPTEACDMVTLCEITPDMLQDNRALPVGVAMPNMSLLVLDPETLEPLGPHEHGELFIVGPSVARAYWGKPELTQAAFHACPQALTDGLRSYRTGDEMSYDECGLFYYHGRYDLQIKLHGFRIELGDIEAALCALPEVHMACVLPVIHDGSISHLVACVVLSDHEAPRGFAQTKKLKAALRDTIPAYMLPRSFNYYDSLPLNASGKADRRALANVIAE